MLNGFVRTTSKLFFGKTLPTLTKWGLGKLLQEYNRILVRLSPTVHHRSLSFAYLPTVDLVQQGISEKVAIIVNLTAAFIAGFVLAFARSWKLALALSSMFPCIAIAGAVGSSAQSKYIQ